MAFVMTPDEEECWNRELELTELEFLQQKLWSRKNDYSPEDREYLEKPLGSRSHHLLHTDLTEWSVPMNPDLQ